MLETLQILNLIITLPMSIFALLMALVKPFRQWILRIETGKRREEDQKETDRCLLRDRITSIYFKHCSEREIKEYEYENVEHLYKQYKKLEGNSFIDKIWTEMQEWRVIR